MPWESRGLVLQKEGLARAKVLSLNLAGRVWGARSSAWLELDGEDRWGQVLQGLVVRMPSRTF